MHHRKLKSWKNPIRVKNLTLKFSFGKCRFLSDFLCRFQKCLEFCCSQSSFCVTAKAPKIGFFSTLHHKGGKQEISHQEPRQCLRCDILLATLVYVRYFSLRVDTSNRLISVKSRMFTSDLCLFSSWRQGWYFQNWEDTSLSSLLLFSQPFKFIWNVPPSAYKTSAERVPFESRVMKKN